MKSDKQIEMLIGQLHIKSPRAIRQRIHAQVQKRWGQYVSDRKSFLIVPRRVRLALVAAVLLVLGVSIQWVDLSVTPAYGLQETAMAIEDIRYFHFWLKDGPDKEISREAWVEYDPNGQLKQVRVDFYQQDQVMVWSGGITQYWSKDNKCNELLLFEDQEYTDKILFFAHRHDPKHALGYLRALEVKKDVQIDYQERAHMDEPISFTVLYEPNTYIIGHPKPAMKEVFTVDPISKLITQIDVYYEKDSQFKGPAIWEYVDYNLPLDADFFVLENEIPDDVNVFNTVGLDLGLAQGDLGNEEIAVKVVEEFLQACLDQDYSRAVRIFGYTSTAQKQWIEDLVRKRILTQIIEIGPPMLPEPPKGGLVVPCTVEFNHAGIHNTDRQTFHVREFSPGRWRIISALKP
jgi:hypothetical protein